jgi:hypothetical protein
MRRFDWFLAALMLLQSFGSVLSQRVEAAPDHAANSAQSWLCSPSSEDVELPGSTGERSDQHCCILCSFRVAADHFAVPSLVAAAAAKRVWVPIYFGAPVTTTRLPLAWWPSRPPRGPPRSS